MISVTNQLKRMIDESFMQCRMNSLNGNARIEILKDRIQPLRLPFTIGKQVKLIAISMVFLQIIDQQGKVFIEAGLWTDIKFYPVRQWNLQLKSFFKEQTSKISQFVQDMLWRQIFFMIKKRYHIRWIIRFHPFFLEVLHQLPGLFQ